MVSCGFSSPRLQLLSLLGGEGGGVHGPSPHAPCLVDQLSHQFCRVSLSLFSLRVTCGDPLDCFLCALLSASSCVTASFMAPGKRVHHLIRCGLSTCVCRGEVLSAGCRSGGVTVQACLSCVSPSVMRRLRGDMVSINAEFVASAGPWVDPSVDPEYSRVACWALGEQS